MSPTVTRRLTALSAVAAGVALLSVAGCSAELAGKNATAVTASASAEVTSGTDSEGPSAGLPEQVTVRTADGVDLSVAGESVLLGNAAATTRVLVYQDLACPHCKSLHDLIGTDLVAWAQSGDVVVEIVTVDFLGGSPEDFSTQAANLLATVAAHDPASWIAVQDAIYAAQGDSPSDASLARLAVDAGAALDSAAVEDFHGQAYDSFVDAATEAALEAGVESIPQVFVDGEPVRGADYEAWGQAVRAAVEASVNGG